MKLNQSTISIVSADDRSRLVGTSSKFNLKEKSKNKLLDDVIYIQKNSGFSDRFVEHKVHDAARKSYIMGDSPMDRVKIICDELTHMPPELNFKYQLLFRAKIDEKTFNQIFDFVLNYNYMSKGQRKRGCYSRIFYELYFRCQKQDGNFDYEKMFEMVKFSEYKPKRKF